MGYLWLKAYEQRTDSQRFVRFDEQLVLDSRNGSVYTWDDPSDVLPSKSILFATPIIREDDHLIGKDILSSAALPVLEPPTPDDSTYLKRQKLYSRMSDRGLYSKSYEEFEKEHSSPIGVEGLYVRLKLMRLVSVSYEEWSRKYFKDLLEKHAFEESRKLFEVNRKLLYRLLFVNDLYSGSFDAFETEYSKPERAKELYDHLQQKASVENASFEQWSELYFGDLLERRADTAQK